MTVAALLWQPGQLDVALAAVADRLGLAPGPLPAPPAAAAHDPELCRRWLASAAPLAGLEARPVEVHGAVLTAFLSAGGPLIIAGTGGYLILTRRHRRAATAVRHDGRAARVEVAAVARWVGDGMAGAERAAAVAVVTEAGVAPGRIDVAADELVARQLAWRAVPGCWELHRPPGPTFAHDLRRGGLRRLAAVAVAAHVAQYGLFIGAWLLIGRAAFRPGGALSAWVAVPLVAIAAARALSSWAAGRLTIDVGLVLRRRLLAGALRLEPSEIRHLGVGRLLAPVLEAEVVQSVAFTAGLTAVLSVVELAAAAAVLVAGGDLMLAGLLIAWTAVGAAAARVYLRRRRAWTRERLAVSSELVEGMVGHRTRLAQEDPAHWHDREDRLLAGYARLSRAMDRSATRLMAAVPRAWLLVALIGLAPLARQSTSGGRLAVAAGGSLLAYLALRTLAGGVWSLGAPIAAWDSVRQLSQAAARPDRQTPSSPEVVAAAVAAPAAAPIIRVEGVGFGYRQRPVLADIDLAVTGGERILLAGPSGAGKSTLVALLSALATPTSGRITHGGHDPGQLALTAWRRIVAAAPQFNDNHILSGTLAFNLLLGRHGPPSRADIDQASALCAELGLDKVLARMPAGIEQQVGETGWQLSHGERSRVYVARALLQGAPLVILDESFGSLDPEALEQTMRCVLDHTQALIVVAHP